MRRKGQQVSARRHSQARCPTACGTLRRKVKKIPCRIPDHLINSPPPRHRKQPASHLRILHSGRRTEAPRGTALATDLTALHSATRELDRLRINSGLLPGQNEHITQPLVTEAMERMPPRSTIQGRDQDSEEQRAGRGAQGAVLTAGDGDELRVGLVDLEEDAAEEPEEQDHEGGEDREDLAERLAVPTEALGQALGR